MRDLKLLRLIRQSVALCCCGLLVLPVVAQQRDKEELMAIMKDIRNRNQQLASVEFELTSKSSVLCPSKMTDGIEAFYVYKGKNKPGFVLVSGDRRMPRILAYSDHNDFDVNNIPPNVAYWLNCYVESLTSLNGQEKKHTSTSFTDLLRENGVSPLLGEMAWGQGNPYNLLCPSYRGRRCVTGCVATGMALVMKYHAYPDKPKGNVSYTTETHRLSVARDLAQDVFLWNKMKDSYEDYYEDDEASAVATLMLDCGASVKMDYSPDASGAYQMNLVSAYVENFSYDRDAAMLVRDYCTEEDWHSFLVRELNEGRPVNYAGSSPSDGGHSFVLDGYKVSEENEYPDYHVNWGWNGECDGYYQIVSLRPRTESSYAIRYGFTEGQQMTIGIKPEDGKSEELNYMCTSDLRVSSKQVKRGDHVKVYSSFCYNLSYESFSGEIAVVLVSAQGAEYSIGRKRVYGWNFLEGDGNFSVDAVVPETMEEGTYAVLLKSKRDDSDQWNIVCATSRPSVMLSESEDVEIKEDDAEPIIVCSEAEIVKRGDEQTVSLNIYEVGSLQETPFAGTLRMVLADKLGHQLLAFGDSVTFGELLYMGQLPDHVNLTGSITGEWDDGQYCLYVGVKGIDEDYYSYVQQFDWQGMMAEPLALYFNVKIENGVAYIGNHAYVIIPTDVMNLEQDSIRQQNRCCTLTGIPVFSSIVRSRPGLYIQGGKKILVR